MKLYIILLPLVLIACAPRNPYHVERVELDGVSRSYSDLNDDERRRYWIGQGLEPGEASDVVGDGIRIGSTRRIVDRIMGRPRRISSTTSERGTRTYLHYGVDLQTMIVIERGRVTYISHN